jgi:hypothetical protein
MIKNGFLVTTDTFSNTSFFKADTLASALQLTNQCDIWQHCPHSFDTVCNVCLWQCTQTSRTPKRGFMCANFRTLPQSRFCHATTRWACLCMLLLTDCGRTVRAMRADGITRRSLSHLERDSRSEMERAEWGHCTQSQVDKKGSDRNWS